MGKKYIFLQSLAICLIYWCDPIHIYSYSVILKDKSKHWSTKWLKHHVMFNVVWICVVYVQCCICFVSILFCSSSAVMLKTTTIFICRVCLWIFCYWIIFAYGIVECMEYYLRIVIEMSNVCFTFRLKEGVQIPEILYFTYFSYIIVQMLWYMWPDSSSHWFSSPPGLWSCLSLEDPCIPLTDNIWSQGSVDNRKPQNSRLQINMQHVFKLYST